MENKEITIERYVSPTVNMYKINGDLVGTINNEHEFNKVRIQMMKKEVTNEYYFMWDKLKIIVDIEGNMSSFPRGLYDQVQRDLAEMYVIERDRRELKNK